MNHRRVHFSEPLHHIEYLDKEWDAASQLARDGSDWLLMGLDRQRFRDRIERTAEILNKILEHDFRQQIYRERFENFCQDTEPQACLALEFSNKNRITSDIKNDFDDKDIETSKNHTVTQEQTSEPNTNSAYISWKRGRRGRHKKGRRRNNKKSSKR